MRTGVKNKRHVVDQCAEDVYCPVFCEMSLGLGGKIEDHPRCDVTVL